MSTLPRCAVVTGSRRKPDGCGCGQPHVTRTGKPSCTSHSNGRLRPEIAGKPCRSAPLAGQAVCRVHGGAAPQSRAAAEERVEREKIAALAAKFTDPVDGETRDPAEIVAEQIRMQYRLVWWLRARVEALGLGDWIWGITKDKIGGDDGGTTYEAKPNAWVQMLREESRELSRLCVDAVRAGLEERRVRLAEKDAEIYVRMLDALVTDLGHDPEDPATAAILERHLRAV